MSNRTAIAIIAPDGNRVVGLFAELPISKLLHATIDDPRVSRVAFVNCKDDWPFQFTRIYVCGQSRWRGYSPDDLPLKYW